MYVCMYVCMYVGMYVGMYVCMYVCICVYTYIHLSLYTYIDIGMYIYIYIYTMYKSREAASKSASAIEKAPTVDDMVPKNMRVPRLHGKNNVT